MDNFQDILNSYSSIDPALGMTQGGVSDTSALVQDAVANYKPMPGSESLSDSLKRISEMNLKSFGEIYANTPDSNIGGSGITLSLNNSKDIGAQLFPPDTSESMWKDIDIDQYYTRMSDSWDSVSQDNASLIGIGGGIATGAVTGAAIGSLVGPVGTAVGAAIGGILGGIEGAQVAENIGYGYVRNKNGVNENSMYQQQGFFGRAGAGIMKLTHNANGMMLGTLATISGVPKALAEKSFTPLFDNKFAKLLDDYDKSSNSSNIIYGSNAYKDSSLLGQTLHSEFWFDKVAPGVGFMLGAVAGGRGASYLLKPLGMGGKVAGSTRAMLRGTAADALASGGKSLTQKALIRGFSNAVRDDLRKTTVKSLAGNFTSLLTSAAPESALEARGAMNEAREQYIESYKQYFGTNPTYEDLNRFEESNKNSGNGVFAANLAVVGMSNLLQFGDALGLDKVVKKGLLDDVVDKAFGLGVRKTLGEISEKGIQSAVWNTVARTTGQKAGYRVFKALEAPLTEGVWEEGIQSVISGTHKNYLESRFNPRATEINKSLLKSFGESFAHTYGSREGWDEILVGMIIGAGGTVMGGEGFLNQKGVTRREAQDVANAENLNKTQVDFIKAQEDYLSKQSIYNNLNNSAIRGVQDRIGALNQQIIGTEASKVFVAEGNLEQAGLAYRNALFAKLAAEKRAGLSESSKFNMEMMLENIPDENLIELGFTTPESRDQFKEESLKGLNDLTESFDIAYKAAEQLDLGTGTTDFSPAQVTEAAALHLFHGMHAGATASTIAQTLEGVLGTTGIASALNYYTNISERNKERIKKVKENSDRVKELEEERNKLLSSYSTQVEKLSRETANEANTRSVDLTDDKINALNSEIEALQNESNTLTNILQDQANIPKLPYGNEAYKFFDSVGLQLADSDVNSVLNSLDSIDKYLEHLADTTGKTSEEIEVDNNKIEMVSSLLDTYKRQMALMRNFAKTAQMVGDKAYTNNMAKSIFNKKKYDAIFDNDEWINNNESGFSEAEKDTYKKLKERVDTGEISKYDFHTYLTNAEILRMNAGIKPSKTVEDLQQEAEDIDNNVKQPIVNETKAKTKERLKKLRDNKLEELQESFWSGVDMGAAIAADRWQDPVENEKVKNPFVEVLTLTKGEKIIDSNGEVKVVDSVTSDIFETVITFEDGTTWTGENHNESTWKVEKIQEEQEISKPSQISKGNWSDRIIDRAKEIMTELAKAEGRTVRQISLDLFDSFKKSPTPTNFANVIQQFYNGVRMANYPLSTVELDIDSVTSQTNTVIGEVRDQQGWHFRIPQGVRTSSGNTRFSLNVNGNKALIDVLDKISADYGIYYKTPTSAAEWTSRHDPVTIYVSNTSLTPTQIQELKDRIIADTKPYIRSNEGFGFYGENISEGIEFGEEASETSASKLIAEAQGIDPTLAEGVKEYLTRNGKVKGSVGMQQAVRAMLDLINEGNQSSRQTETKPKVTPFSDLLTQYEIEVDKIEAQYREAIAQVDVPTNEIATALDRLNNAINSIVENVISRGRTINKEYVESFGQEDSLLDKEVKRAQTLLNKGVLSMEETNELNSLLEKVNSYGTVEGRVSDVNGTPIRLSDLLEQRAQLETEFFNDKKTLVQLTEQEIKDSTFDSQEENIIPTKEGQSLGDAAVLNSYDFSTFTPLEEDYQISNITPEGFTSKIIGENDADIFIRKPDGSVTQVTENWDRQAEPGDTVSVQIYTGDTSVNIDFSIDTSRRILLPQYLRDVIHDHTDLRFEDKNQIGSTAHYVLTTNNNGTEVYLGSDFDVELDSKAAQNLNPGEPLFFEYDMESDWNLDLEKKYREALPDPEVIEYYDMLTSLVDEYRSANTERKAEIKKELSVYLPDSGNKIPQYRATINKDRAAYEKSFSSESKDAIRREFKNSMRIVAVDKNGNRVGVVKSLGNSNVYGKGREKMDHLRAQLFEDLEKSDFVKVKSKFSAPIQIVYMGIPNVKSNENGKVIYRFSNQPGETNINPKAVKSIGYVSYNTIKFKDGRKVNTPYNYAKKLMDDTRNKGVNIPVILFEHAGKEIIYPINLIEKNTESLIDKLKRILELEGSVALSETISNVNKLLAENGIDKSVRVTSLNYAQDIKNAVEVVSNIPNIPTLTEIMEADNFRDILQTSAIVDINIEDTPFVGPKIRFDITQVPNFTSDIVEESTPEFSVNLEDEINNDKENKSCLE